LKLGDEIVLSAMYARIEPFVGYYTAYSIAEGRWGVLTRQGRVIISPEYKTVNVMPNGTAMLSINGFTERTVDLKMAEQEAQED